MAQSMLFVMLISLVEFIFPKLLSVYFAYSEMTLYIYDTCGLLFRNNHDVTARSITNECPVTKNVGLLPDESSSMFTQSKLKSAYLKGISNISSFKTQRFQNSLSVIAQVLLISRLCVNLSRYPETTRVFFGMRSKNDKTNIHPL